VQEKSAPQRKSWLRLRALRRRVRVSHPNLLIFLQYLGEVSQDSVGGWDSLTRGCQIQRSRKTTALNDRPIKTCVDRFTSDICTVHSLRFFFVCSQTYMCSDEKERKKLQQRLLTPSGVPSLMPYVYCQIPAVLSTSMPVTFTVKFHYLHLSPLLLFVPDSFTFIFHTPLEIILYLQTPVLENSKTTDLQPNSITCKFVQSFEYL